MNVDDTGTPTPAAARAQKLLKRKVEDRMERQHIRETIESAGWRVFFERAIAPMLKDWRRDLLTRVDLPEPERQALVRARLLILEGIVSCYDLTGAHVPEWLMRHIKEFEDL